MVSWIKYLLTCEKHELLLGLNLKCVFVNIHGANEYLGYYFPPLCRRLIMFL